MAESFNNYFNNIPQTLSNRLGKSSIESDIVYFLDPVSSEINKYDNDPSVLSIKKYLAGNRKSKSNFYITVKTIKENKDLIAYFLTHYHVYKTLII